MELLQATQVLAEEFEKTEAAQRILEGIAYKCPKCGGEAVTASYTHDYCLVCGHEWISTTHT